MFSEFSELTVLIAAAVCLIIWIGIMLRIQTAKVVLIGMIFVSAIGAALTWRGGYLGSWLLPLQLYRSDIFLALGILLLASFLGVAGHISLNRTAPQAWILLVIGLYAGFLRVFHDSGIEGAMSMGFTLATILPLILIVPALLREKEDWYGLLRMLMWANLVWVAACGVQFMINPAKVMIPGLFRFYGIAANPVFASNYLAVPAVVGLWLILNDSKWRYRWLWIAMFGANIMMMLATGSRSGALYFVIGAVAVLYRRWGRSTLLLPLAVLSVILAFQFIGTFGVNLGFERVTSMEDTRTAAWLMLIEEGLRHPLIGVGISSVSRSENSYLYAFASFGLPMMAACVVYLLYSMSYCLRMRRASLAHPSWRPLVDMMIAFNAMYFASTMLDGIILARTDPMLMNMMVFSAMGAMFLQAVRTGEVHELDKDAAEADAQAAEADAEYDYELSYDAPRA
jgi:hypothetical protein